MPEGEYQQYGGQAIIEGVMMRSPKFFAVACRAPNGTIVRETEPIEKTWIGKQKWLMKPFLRGSWALLDSMTLGVRAMRFASNVQMDPAYQKPDEAMEAFGSKKIQDLAIGGTIIVSIALGLFLFNFLPNLLGETLRGAGVESGTAINFAVEIIKAVFVFAYIYGISRLKDIQEVFKYHGAEHKAINALEAGKELTVENVRAQTRFHPRCGTSFIVIVILVSMVVSTPIPRYLLTGGHQGMFFLDVLARFAIEILFILPLVAGLSYELIRIAGKFRDARWVQIFFAPGLWTQRLTTSEPEDHQIEVAIASLEAVVESEKGANPDELWKVRGELPAAS